MIPGFSSFTVSRLIYAYGNGRKRKHFYLIPLSKGALGPVTQLSGLKSSLRIGTRDGGVSPTGAGLPSLTLMRWRTWFRGKKCLFDVLS